jgi:hypothetical protein
MSRLWRIPPKFEYHFLLPDVRGFFVIPFDDEDRDFAAPVDFERVSFGFELWAVVWAFGIGVMSPKAAKAFVISLLLPGVCFHCPAHIWLQIFHYDNLLPPLPKDKWDATYIVSPVDNWPLLLFWKRKVWAKPTTPTRPCGSDLKVTGFLSKICNDKNSFRKLVLNVLNPAKLMVVSFSPSRN